MPARIGTGRAGPQKPGRAGRPVGPAYWRRTVLEIRGCLPGWSRGHVTSLGGHVASLGGHVASLGGQVASLGGHGAQQPVRIVPGCRDDRSQSSFGEPVPTLQRLEEMSCWMTGCLSVCVCLCVCVLRSSPASLAGHGPMGYGEHTACSAAFPVIFSGGTTGCSLLDVSVCVLGVPTGSGTCPDPS